MRLGPPPPPESEHLKKSDWLRQFDLHLTPQGSVALGTAVPPLPRKHGEHDVDLLLKVMAGRTAFTSTELHRRIGDQLRAAYREIMHVLRYGWQLDYGTTERFHFDIIGVIPWVHGGRPMVAVCDWRETSWKESNPEDFIREFLATADKLPLIEDPEYRDLSEGKIALFNCARSVTVDPLPEETLMKTPLQRGVQFTKRHRDIWFSNRDALDRRTPSIVLTTILWQAYGRFIIGKTFPSIFSVIETMADHIDDSSILQVTTDHQGVTRYFLANPTVPGENLVARWNETGREREAVEFYAWAKDFKTLVRSLSKTEGMFRLQPMLRDALGKDAVDPVFKRITGAVHPNSDRTRLRFSSSAGITTSASAAAVPLSFHTFDGSP